MTGVESSGGIQLVVSPVTPVDMIQDKATILIERWAHDVERFSMLLSGKRCRWEVHDAIWVASDATHNVQETLVCWWAVDSTAWMAPERHLDNLMKMMPII